ncbi:MAG: alkaline phosphatase family protein [Jatrophihabitantaceae bacterium]
MSRLGRRLLPLAAALALLAALTPASPAQASTWNGLTATPIKHFLFLLQGDRSFDNYFGSYPGADGIAHATCQRQAGGKPADCVKPFPLHGTALPPLGATASVIEKQYDNGKMDGFVSALQSVGRDGSKAMGYYDQQDLPAYWRAASQYVLFDRFFSATRDGVRSNRAYWVSATDAAASADSQPLTIFDQLQAAGISSWKFYVQNYRPVDGPQVGGTASNTQDAAVPLLNYPRFTSNPALRSHIVDLGQYYQDLQQGTLPAVAYFATSGSSERSARSISEGQSLVTSLTGQLMLSRFWSSSAFLLSYDGTGGFYDHVRPPQVDGHGLGLRVPALLISSFARRGMVNHITLDYTSALSFIETNWELEPLATRERLVGSLQSAFDFTSPPRPPELIANGSPPTPQGKLGSTGIVYLSYGAALAVVAATVGFAFARSRVRRPHPVLPATVETVAPLRIGADRR